jgi:hypothetical protein
MKQDVAIKILMAEATTQSRATYYIPIIPILTVVKPKPRS